MTTVTSATKLTIKGKRKLLELIAEHANQRCLDFQLSGWLTDLHYNAHGEGTASIEIGGYYTESGNPVTYDFSGDEVEIEEVEMDDDD